MTRLPEPLATVLRDFCHVEWFEVDELAAHIHQGDLPIDFEKFAAQLQEAIAAKNLPVAGINELTANEFASTDEARRWLHDIFAAVFEGQ